MATIPLVALDSRAAQEQQGPLAQYAALQQIKGAQTQQKLASTEVQQKQLQLQDTQATTAAMKEWDGKNPDDLPPLVLKHGGSSTAVFGLKNQILDWKTKATKLSTDQLDNLNKTNDIISGHLESVKNADDKPAAYTAAIQDLQKNGLAKPGQFPDQYPGDEWLDQQEKQHMGQKAIVDQAQKQKEIEQKGQQLDLETKKFEQTQPGGALENPEQKFLRLDAAQKQKQPISDADKAFLQSYKTNKTMVPIAQFNLQNAGAAADANGNPSQIAQMLAANKMKWSEAVSMRTPQSVKNEIMKQVFKLNPNFDTGEFGLEQDAAKKARSGAWADTRLAYNTALDHSDLLLKAADALNNGDTKALNSLENNFKTQFGWSGKINFDAIANAYNHEVTSVVSKGHITDAEVSSGHATLPDDVNAKTIHDVVNSYKSLMTSKRDELDKIIKAGAGNKANAIINTGSSSGDTNTGGGKKVLSPAEWLKQQKPNG
jgi:hypothetical protein